MTALCRAVIPGLPSLPADLIERPALWARLDQGVQCPLTLVVAPGGYGKTSAVATWLARRQPDWKEREAVWYTVDSLDAPPSSFLAQVVSAIQAGFPGSCGQTCQMLEKAPISPIEQLAIQLAQDITALPKGLVLVLDDCDKVEQTATLGWLETLVRHASPALSLVWISRCDPPFSVARLRSQSRLVELRLADLQLSTAEVQSVLETHMSEPVPPALAEKLTAHLEGWGAGLRLLTLSLRTGDELAQYLRHPDLQPQPPIFENFIAEVLASHPTAIQSFLLYSSLLPYLHPELCAVALRPRVDAEQAYAQFHYVRRHNLFVLPLDEIPGGYRYHALFKAILQDRLRKAVPRSELDALYLRCAHWYVKAGDFERAIECCLAGHNLLVAASLTEFHIHTWQEQAQWDTLERVLGLLPTEVVEQSPALLLAYGWLYQFWGQAELLRATVAQVNTLLENRTLAAHLRQQLKAESMLLSQAPMIAAGPPLQAIQCIQQARCEAAPLRPFLEGMAHYLLALYQQHTGAAAEALQLLDQIFVGEMHPPSVQLRLLRARCMVLLYEGKITNLALSAGMYLQLAQRHPQRFDLSSAHFMVACAHYFMAAQDDTALQHCWEILRHSHTTYRTTLVAAVSMLIELLLARGALAEAEQAAATFRSDAYRIQSPHALSDAALLDAQIAIHQNDLARALPWLQNFSGCSARPNELLSGVVWAAGLLALREPSWLAAGNGWVGAMLERCQATHAQVWVVRLQVLRARFFAAKGNRQAAQQSLHAALLIGCPNQLFRPFLVDDPALDPLLAVLSRQPDGQLAAAVLQRRRTGTPALPQPAAEPAPSPALPPLFEPLTDREAAVLQLLAGNLSRKEIAQTLQISVHTLDKHLRALYAKLQSHNRLEAVYRAHQRGLLLEP